MVSKKELLKNVRNYSPQEIADAVRAGMVSLYDLTKETEGAFTPLLKRQVKSILETPIAPPAVKTAEPNTTNVVSSSISQNEPSIPVVAPSIPVAESSIPVVSLNEPIVDNKEAVSPDSTQITRENPTDKKPAMFSRLFSFNGRIRRLEYGLTYLAYCIWNVPMRVMSEDQISEGYAIFYLVTLLPILWVFFAQGAKRCHDRGNSGWYQIIPFYMMWMIFADGEKETNNYGVCPK